MTREETIHELDEWLKQMIQHDVPSHSAKRKALATAIALLSAEAADVYKAHEEEHLNIINRIKELQYAIAKTQTIVGKMVESAEAEQVTGKLKNHCDSLLKSDSDECKEQKSKLDLISRADAIEAVRLETGKLGRGLLGRGDILDIISALPSAEAEKTYIGIDIPYGSDKGIATIFKRKDDKLILEEVKELVRSWIPCSERLPEVGEICLLTVREYGWNCKDYTRVIIGEYSDNYADHILAWMPLPDPYTEMEP